MTLQSIRQPGLAPSQQRLVARTMLIGVASVMVLAVILFSLQKIRAPSSAARASDSAQEGEIATDTTQEIK